MRIFERILDKITGSLAFVSGGLVALLMLLMVYLVGARYIFQKPPPWGIEISEYVLATYTFLGAAWLLKRGGHVRVDLVLRRINEHSQTAFNIINSIIGAVICLIILIFGVLVTINYIQIGARTPNVIVFPSFILICFIPIGFLFLFLQFIRETYRAIIKLNK